jgi:hypothetical protein
MLDVLDSLGGRDVEQVHEPIDVLVDIIIGYLEKGTAFMRAVGNRSFTLLSGAIKESTVNLILTVSISGDELSSIINIISSNWNVGILLNFLRTQTLKGIPTATDIRKTVVMTTSPLPGLKTVKLTQKMMRK